MYQHPVSYKKYFCVECVLAFLELSLLKIVFC